MERFCCLMFCGAILLGVPGFPTALADTTLETTEVSLGQIAEGVSMDDIKRCVSNDLRHVGFRARRGEKWVVVIDGKEGPSYDDVTGPSFSYDSQHFFYNARNGGAQFFVVDGVEGRANKPWDEGGGAMISHDNKRMAYRVRRGDKTVVVMDGVEGKPYAEVESQEFHGFSRDSKHLAYVAVLSADPKNRQSTCVVDGVEGKIYSYVWDLRFSPDSQHVAYVGDPDKDTAYAVIDGVEGPKFARISAGGVLFSPDSKHTAYVAHPSHSSFTLVVDGKPGRVYDEKPEGGKLAELFPRIEFSHTPFSPDSAHTAYMVITGRGTSVVRDGIESCPWRELAQCPTFSPDSQHLGYVGVRDGMCIMVLDGKEGRPYYYIGDPVFSPDSKHLAYVAQNLFSWTIVLDGKEGQRHKGREAWRERIEFSPDSQCVAFAFQAFSPDSKHLAYWEPSDKGKWRVVVDERATPEYDGHIVVDGVTGEMFEYGIPSHIGMGVAFDGPFTLHALAIRKGEILRLEVRIVPH